MKGGGRMKRSEFIAMLETVVDAETALKVTTKLEEELFVPVWFKDYHCLCTGKREWIDEDTRNG
jgi:hypothetical protein